MVLHPRMESISIEIHHLDRQPDFFIFELFMFVTSFMKLLKISSMPSMAPTQTSPCLLVPCASRSWRLSPKPQRPPPGAPDHGRALGAQVPEPRRGLAACRATLGEVQVLAESLEPQMAPESGHPPWALMPSHVLQTF